MEIVSEYNVADVAWLLCWQTLDDRRPKPPPRRKKPAVQTHGAGMAGGDPTIDDEDDDDFRPVNVDMNAVKNLLQSYEAQQGHAGPTSNILGGLGIRLPPPSPPDDL